LRAEAQAEFWAWQDCSLSIRSLHEEHISPTSFVYHFETMGSKAKEMTYVALIRGINVGGSKIVHMEPLRKELGAMGLHDVKTYVQSGNVVFKTPQQACDKLSRQIEEMVSKRFGVSASVIVKTAEDVCAAVKNNPFLKEQGADVTKFHVTFLSAVPQKDALKKLKDLSFPPERFCCVASEIYLECPNGVGQSRLPIQLFEKLLGVRATSRNWRTVNKLAEMCSE